MIVVSNASPLIALSRIDQLRILKALFAHVYIPDTVYQETVTNCDIVLQTSRISQATNEFIEVDLVWLERRQISPIRRR